MTTSIKFKLVDKTPVDEGTVVNWVVGVSDGVGTSTGTGTVVLTESLRGLGEDEILQLALNAQGGIELVDSLYAYHSENLRQCHELTLFEDWYTAYVFASNQLGTPIDTTEQAYENVSLGFGTYHTKYNHSIFNITEQCHWSHTFVYHMDGGRNSENETGRTFHVKVRNGAVVEWYERIRDFETEWTALDLVTGQPIEYYKVIEGEVEGTTVMQKFNVSDDSLATSTTHGQPGLLAIPEDFEQGLTEAGFEHRDCVFGYATKSYGKIVEYTLLAHR